MQEEQQQQNWGGHKCHNGMCGCAGHHMGFHILRWVLGIVVILMIFGFGVQIGEFKSAFESGGYGRHQMMLYRGEPQGNMMFYGQSGEVVPSGAVTVSAQGGAVKK